MDVEILRTFLAVAREGSQTRAAAGLYRTQSAVSQRVRQLEEELGAKLFDQIGRSLVLTEAGRTLLPEAERLVADAERAREAVAEVAGLKRGRLRVGASTTPGIYLLPEAIARFRRAHPGVEVALSIHNTREVERRVSLNELDLAFVGGPLARADLTEEPLADDALVAFATRRHPLARSRRIPAAKLVAEPFVLREPGSATREATERWAAERRLALRAALEFDNPEAVKRAVAAGLGVSIISRFALSTELRAGTVRVLRIEGLPIRRPLRAILHPGKHRGAAVEAFLAAARAFVKASR